MASGAGVLRSASAARPEEAGAMLAAGGPLGTTLEGSLHNALDGSLGGSLGGGLDAYYRTKIGDLVQVIEEKRLNLRRLEAQRNTLNGRVRALKEELQRMQEPPANVGEIVKMMSKQKALVKIHPDGKFFVDIDEKLLAATSAAAAATATTPATAPAAGTTEAEATKGAADATKASPAEGEGSTEVERAAQGEEKAKPALKAGVRVALRSDTYKLFKVLPSQIDPLVSLMMVEKVPDATYDMIGGLENQIKEIKEVIELPIKHPELFESLGIAQPKGVLLYGPPGTGKTLLARAAAHHTDCKFIRVSGSELVQKYIGEGSRMVRELFVMAREHAPSIIFMDEIDSIGSARSESGGGGGTDSEVQRTMLELLNQLDGFEASHSIKVIMATNRIDILDSALLRPGRIDRKIEFPAPNTDARLEILKIHSRRMNLARNLDLRTIAEKLVNASGAEVKGVCTEAGMFALRERRIHVIQEDFEMSVAKVMKKDGDANMSIKKLFK